MSVVPRQVATTSQPQHAAQVDWSNPITRGLVLADTVDRNLVTGIGYSAGASQRRATPAGIGLGSAATAGATVGAVDLSGTNAITFGCHVRADALVDSVVAEHGPNFNSNAQVGWIVVLLANGQLQVGYTGNANNAVAANITANSVITAGRTYFVLTRMKRTNVAGAAGNGITIWLDGVQQAIATPSGGNNPGGGNFSRATTYLNSRAASSLFLNGYTANRRLWNRALTDAEIRSISANPWQVFRSRRLSPIITAQVGIYRPTADIVDGTWLAEPAGDLYAAIDEAVPSDADYIYTAIAGATPATIAIGPIPAGSNTLSIRASASAATTLRVSLLDAANTVVGTVDQALTSTPTTYTLSVTTSAQASRVRVELI
jgi:hypothetical protein